MRALKVASYEINLLQQALTLQSPPNENFPLGRSPSAWPCASRVSLSRITANDVGVIGRWRKINGFFTNEEFILGKILSTVTKTLYLSTFLSCSWISKFFSCIIEHSRSVTIHKWKQVAQCASNESCNIHSGWVSLQAHQVIRYINHLLLIVPWFQGNPCLSTSAVLWLDEPSRDLYQAELSFYGLAPFVKPFRISVAQYD